MVVLWTALHSIIMTYFWTHTHRSTSVDGSEKQQQLIRRRPCKTLQVFIALNIWSWRVPV